MFTQSTIHLPRRSRPLALLVLATLAFTLTLLGCGSTGQAQSPERRVSDTHQTTHSAAQQVRLTVETAHPGPEFAQGAVGLSVETNQLATEDLSATHTSLVALMRLLGPGVLRIGGSSLDYSWWTSNGEPAPAWAKTIVDPNDLITLRRLLIAADWRVILGVDLGHFDPVRAANEAGVAQQILGSRLLGFEIGNEPDSYAEGKEPFRPASYNLSNYLGEIATYSATMRAAAPDIRLYGPDVSSSAWLPGLALDKAIPFNAITEHYYPTKYSVHKGSCEGTPIPSAGELLSPYIRERESLAAQTLVEAGHIAHREVRISETNNTSSCDVEGGPDTSPVFASALWSLDWALRATSAGVAGVNFHGNFGLCPPNSYSPVCEPDSAAAARGQVTARPEYYGLLAARQLEGGRFVPARLVTTHSLPNIVTWATVDPNGTLKIAIENFATEGLPQPISIPVSGYSGTRKLLVGQSVEAATGIAFGDVSITSSGQWRPKSIRLYRVHNYFRVVVRPASAILVTLRPKRIQ